MAISVVPYSEESPAQFERVARDLRADLSETAVVAIEHVGSDAERLEIHRLNTSA